VPIVSPLPPPPWNNTRQGFSSTTVCALGASRLPHPNSASKRIVVMTKPEIYDISGRWCLWVPAGNSRSWRSFGFAAFPILCCSTLCRVPAHALRARSLRNWEASNSGCRRQSCHFHMPNAYCSYASSATPAAIARGMWEHRLGVELTSRLPFNMISRGNLNEGQRSTSVSPPLMTSVGGRPKRAGVRDIHAPAITPADWAYWPRSGMSAMRRPEPPMSAHFPRKVDAQHAANRSLSGGRTGEPSRGVAAHLSMRQQSFRSVRGLPAEWRRRLVLNPPLP
jgi:hypothetical protein